MHYKGKSDGVAPFGFVPKEARGCMTDEELEDALQSMNLSPDEEKAVREVCRKGFVTELGLMESEVGGPVAADDGEDDDEEAYDAYKCLANGKYGEVARNVFYSVLGVNRLLVSAIYRAHRLEGLTSLQCPDIITTNEARMAREKIEAIQEALDAADEELRKLQLKTDHRSAEKRLLDAVFGEGGGKGGGRNAK
jgi:hypothetical protein